MGNFFINIQNKETCVRITGGSTSYEEVYKVLRQHYPKVRIRKVQSNVLHPRALYLRMKMTKVQIRVMTDYLSFLFPGS